MQLDLAAMQGEPLPLEPKTAEKLSKYTAVLIPASKKGVADLVKADPDSVEFHGEVLDMLAASPDTRAAIIAKARELEEAARAAAADPG